jgi:hypothetical protein
MENAQIITHATDRTLTTDEVNAIAAKRHEIKLIYEMLGHDVGRGKSPPHIEDARLQRNEYLMKAINLMEGKNHTQKINNLVAVIRNIEDTVLINCETLPDSFDEVYKLVFEACKLNGKPLPQRKALYDLLNN